MTSRLRHTLWLVLALGAVPVFAQTPVSPPLPGTTGKVALPPPLPPLKSPIDLFRQLLAMSSADRDKELAKRPPEIRKRILAKLDEYAAMKPADRDLRLRLTDLRWYVLSLIQTPPDERTLRLGQIPESDRASVNDRLKEWNDLPENEQKEILKYEKTMEQFVDQGLDGHVAASNILANVATPMRPDALQNLDNFLNLPLERRQQMYASFQRFFELNDEEKQKAVGALPETQREQMATLLRSFGRLPQEERAELVKCLGKFSTMSADERAEFMKNAERWRELSPAERAAWRTLVNRLPPAPPLPPGIVFPPMPPRAHLQASLPVATNSTP